MIGHLTVLVVQPLSPPIVRPLLSICIEKVAYLAWLLSSSSFVYSFNKYLLNTYSVTVMGLQPNYVLGGGEPALNTAKFLLMEMTF